MAWNHAKYLENVANSVIPAGLYLYGGSSDTVTEDPTGRRVPNLTGSATDGTTGDPLSVWLAMDTDAPYQSQEITSDANGVVPVFGVPSSPVVVNFAGVDVFISPWNTDMRVNEVAARFDTLSTNYVARNITQNTAPGEVVNVVRREYVVSTTDADLDQIYSTGEKTSWRNEIGHYRAQGYTLNPNDPPYRAILGPNQVGHAFELESNDRTKKIWGINPQGYAVVNGLRMSYVLTLSPGAPIPAGTPANTLIVRI